MKKCLIALLICLGTLGENAFSQTANDYVTNGLTDLANQDVVDANTNFQEALVLSPTNEAANVLLAATRLLVLPQTPTGSNYLNSLGFSVTGRNIYDWTSFPGTNSYGGPLFPANYNSTNAVFFFRTNVMPLINASLANLSNMTDTNFQLQVNLGEAAGTVTLDYGDVQMLRTLLTAAEFAGYTLNANNAGVIIPQVETWAETNGFTLQLLLSTYTSLGVMENTGDLALSENAATNAIELYFGASDFIRNDRAPDSEFLFNISPDQTNKEAEFRTGLTNALLSLSTPTEFVPSNYLSTVYLAPYFSGTNSLRKLVPQFNGNIYQNNTVPDYTFDGIFPYLPAYETEAFLRKALGSRAGIYMGYVQDDTYNDPGAGSFGVLYNTNGQMDIVGFDHDTIVYYNYQIEYGGFLVQVTANADGQWQISNSSVTGFGKVGRNGSFYGELTFATGDVVELVNSYEISPPDQFTSAAGYYTGNPSGGSVAAVLGADGELVFRVLDSSGTSTDGGYTQLEPDNTFSTYSSGGALVSGTLNPSTFQITGTYGNSGNPYTLTRSVKFPYDTPPVITTNLPLALTVGLTNTTTFQLGAAGSSPLGYQWYFNGNPIPGATASTLVVSNNLWTSTGNDQISATVNNAVGGTNSLVCSVTVETTLPPLANYAGIYIGDQNSVDNEGDSEGLTDNEGFYGGNFAVYLNTNGQSVLVGYDLGDESTPNDNSNFGVYVPFTMGKGGNWQSSTSAYNAYGYVDDDADFFGEVDYTNGVSVYLDGAYESPLGPFQTSAGYYTGTFTGGSGGSFYGIVASDDEFFYIPIESGNNVGSGGSAIIVGPNNQFSYTQVTGTVVSGTLNTNTYVINGIYTNPPPDNSGTFTISRSGQIPTPPVITNDLPVDVVIPLGNTTVFNLGVSSSTPLSYQWYFDSNSIPGATASTLAVSNNLWTAPGLYYISAIVSNNVGETASRVCSVGVTLETNVPAITITSPTAGQLWSNATFTVTGTASDKLAVTNVYCSVNNGPYVPATNLNNWANWSLAVSLTPGTNTINAYAVNEGGISSPVASVSFKYVVSASLTIQMSGLGTINPDYSNAVLAVGQNYTISASPANGFIFTNWITSTNFIGGVVSNNPTLLFTMAPNLTLQANFAETAKPTVDVTNLSSGQQVSNAVFTVEGTASDIWHVSSVWYQLNGTGWNLATNLNNGTNWAAGTILTPGTNVFQVYAVNLGGQLSTTDTVSCQYIVSTALKIQLSGGLGTINPDYSNAVLAIGQEYSISASPANGFMFTNWVVSTNFIGGVVSNSSSLLFTMATNLTLQANFTETAKPTVNVTNLSSGQQVSNAVFTVEGNASDDWLVSNVWYQVNGTGWNLATNLNNGTNWAAGVTFTPGTNVFQVYAVNLGGQLSTTDTVSCQYIVSTALKIQLGGGLGTINPDYSNAVLAIGQEYSISASPANGFMFTNWVTSTNFIGGVVSNNATLLFTMATNLTLQANFAETAKPTVNVTNLSSGQQVSNAVFTVEGTASDDWLVSNVWYQVNGTGWNLATNLNNGTNWAAGTILTPGTNVFQVYAVNLGGQLSTTDTVSCQYIVSKSLTIRISGGLGTINPDYSNAVLAIGQEYTISASPANGFMFTNWVTSTNFIGGVVSNNATLLFTMATNLTLQANFAETAKPTVNVTNLSSGQQVSNAVFTVEGTASDDWLVSNVWYQVNGTGWNLATNLNNGTNWAAGTILTPGTNVFQVYAVNLGGQLSTTDTVSCQYIVSTTLKIQLNGGLGTIDPDYSNAVLAIGQEYTISASPANGFMFTNWVASTNFIGGVVSNNATLLFTMATNLTLQANFAETAKPTVNVTNLSSGQQVSNAVFTVEGNASDDWLVSNVWYQVDGTGWNLATNLNNGTNWAAGVTFTPGTNVFQVYAVNLGGQLSTTDTVSCQYIVSKSLTIRMSGLGTINPDYSSAVLAIGQEYSISASPANGFMFTNWITSTNFIGGVVSNNATLLFTMATNLTLQANFAETAKPTVNVTNLSSGQQVSNAVFTIEGNASDDWLISNVWYQVNGTGWNLATNLNNGTNWAAGATFTPGTNVFQVYAVNLGGQLSTTDTVSFQYIVSTTLGVKISGLGTINPDYSNAVLAIGQEYSVTASPANGFMFTNWITSTNFIGGVVSNNATLLFTMATNLTLQANFAETAKPTVNVTNLSSGQQVSNAVFTVEGNASDDWLVSNVWYQVNGTGWNLATNLNNGTNWAAGTKLTPGTNVFQVYAVNLGGLASVTNGLSFQYLVTNLLVVEAEGLGTLSPDYSNAWLNLGQNYSMNASPANGFMFTNWVVSTNFIGGVKTNNATVQFMMASNLTLQVNFAETAKPMLTISSPSSGTHTTNALATVVGTASDDWKVALVSYQLNNSAWNSVLTTNGYTNWTSTVELQAGTNTFNAYALNLGGNYSSTNTLSLISTNAFKLQLTFGAQPLTANGFNISLQISPGMNGHIQDSTNLTTWITLTNFVGTNSTIIIQDPSATNQVQKFYRAVVP